MPIFKAYDVRGIYPSELNEEIMYRICRAFADFLKGKTIMVAHDMRLSSLSLNEAVIKGINDQGVDVIDIGLCSTPMSYFGCAFTKADGALQVTASHNPKEYNGCKFMRKMAIPISGDTGIKEIEKIVNANKFRKINKKGKIIERDVKEDYVKHVLGFIDKRKIKKLKIVVDSANGMGCLETDLILEKLPIEIIKMYCEIDGNFPNHEADPLKEKNTIDLRERVKKEKADLGIAFDGDADRVFFIDEKGNKMPSDFITCLIAKEFLKEKKREKILYDLRSSWIVKEEVEKLGGKAYMSKVGHAFIKEQLRKENAIFGGELSGHYYFKDNFYTDSAIIASLKIIQLLSRGKKLSQLVKPLQKYFASGEINFEVSDKEAKMKELEKAYSDGKISHLDGIRIDFKDWWFNVRPSNTEPLLRLNLEAKTKEITEKKKGEIEKIIKK